MKKRAKNAIVGFVALAIIVAWIILLFNIKPQDLVARIGSTNGYVILFLMGTFGGASIFAGPSYFLALSTLAIGGLNPFLLGICGGTGLAIGDSIIFLLGLSAAQKAPEKFQKKMDRLRKIVEKRKNWMVNLALYLYLAFTPLPNEVATIPLGLVGVERKRIILYLLLANITSGILIALLAPMGISIFK